MSTDNLLLITRDNYLIEECLSSGKILRNFGKYKNLLSAVKRAKQELKNSYYEYGLDFEERSWNELLDKHSY